MIVIRRRFLVFAFAALVPCAPRVVAAAAPLDLSGAFPADHASRVCPDTPLRLRFPSPPVLGSSGRIRIIDASDRAVVDTIDVGAHTAIETIGGLPGFRYYPVTIQGRVATIHPRNGALHYHHTYYVTIDPGVFRHDGEAYGGITRPDEWRFSTRAAAPPPGTTTLTVAADGTGDFCTVQGALDFIPDGNTTPTTVHLRPGTYAEIVFFTNKHDITLIGDDRRRCVITYPNNARFNPSGGNPYGGRSDNPSAQAVHGGHIYHRGVFMAHRDDNLTLANLTIRNTTPVGGSQAEALILNGTADAHAILADVDLFSHQDTLQINGQAYVRDCRIEGDVDFMWGTGPCFFEDCTCRDLRSHSYYTQIRNPGTHHGYVFLHCVFDGAPGVTGCYLSRIGTGRFPHSEVVLLDCTLSPAVNPVGWLLLGGREGNPRDVAQVHFWEYRSHDAGGQPVDVSRRMSGSRQLHQADDAALIADYRNPTYVLGGGWHPRSAPIFSSDTLHAARR